MKQKSGLLYLILCVSLVTLIVVMIIALALVLKNNRDNAAITTTEKGASTPITTNIAVETNDVKTGTVNTNNMPTLPTVETYTLPPVTDKPVTQTTAPVTEKPVTQTTAPVTEKPVTQTTAPVTEKPATQTTAPVTEKPATQTTTAQTEKPVTTAVTTKPSEPDDPVIPDDKEAADRSGTIYSAGDPKFRIAVDWSSHVDKGSDKATLKLDIYFEGYSLKVSARKNGKITIAGKNYTFETENIYVEYSTVTRTPMASTTIEVDLAGSDNFDLTVAWYFNGTRNSTEEKIKWMTATGEISFRQE